MAAQTAIDYGARRVRLLEFDGSGRKLRVLGVRDVDLEPPGDLKEGEDPDDWRAKAIAAAMSEEGFASDPSGMAFPAAHAMSREFDLPFTAREQIDKVAHFECESHFPGDIDESVVQHVVLRQTRDKSHLLAVAVRKDELLDRLDILDESGLDPMFVELDDLAFYQALVSTGLAGSAGERAVVVNAQDVTTTLLFLQAGTLYALRSVRLGTQGLLRAPQDQREKEVDDARRHDLLARLMREIRRTLGALPDAGAPGKVLLAGSGAALPGLSEALAQVFGAPIEELDFLAHVDHKLDDADAARLGPDLGAALGVAFRLNGQDDTLTDFRREEAAYTRKFDQVKTPLIAASFLAFLLVAFLGLDQYMEARRVRQEYRQIVSVGKEQLAGLLVEDPTEADRIVARHDDEPAQVDALLAATLDLQQAIEGELGRSQTIPDLPSALATWIDFSQLVIANEAALGRLALERLDTQVMGRQPFLKLKGQVEDATRYQTLLDVLRSHEGFVSVEPGATRQLSSGMLGFEEITVGLPAQEGA
ncbi:MAG: hypothetical protein FJ296_00975 [Planctomycetes bacterium]|nr:hypothetical protein [Planctomycetota bacterium]